MSIYRQISHRFFRDLIRLTVTLSLALFGVSQSWAINLEKEPKLQPIAKQLVAAGHYSNSELEAIFASVTLLPSVLEAMQNPAEYKFTWGKYRKIFIQDDRINGGLEFWQEYRTELSRAEQEYGVPASMIVAIIGVESKFGKYKCKHKVLDSLVTLVTGYPRRSEFFAKELKEFLILTKENGFDASNILGSYAGAVGYPQFISSSYRHYAVDFSGDGVTDLINQPIDAIGSVANYFNKNGWLAGQPVTSTPVSSVSPALRELANRKRKVQFSVARLRELGATLDPQLADTEQLNVLEMNASEIVPEDKQPNTYIVRAGDTICEIAEKFELPCKTLIGLNKVNNQGSIYRGQKLKLPVAKNKTRSQSDSKWELSVPATPNANEQWQYFFTHENFYVITRYNQSVLYAMAVYDLSEALRQGDQAKAQHGAR